LKIYKENMCILATLHLLFHLVYRSVIESLNTAFFTPFRERLICYKTLHVKLKANHQIIPFSVRFQEQKKPIEHFQCTTVIQIKGA
jgi:hypothetical protein